MMDPGSLATSRFTRPELPERHTHQAAAATDYALARGLQKLGGDYLYWVPTLIFYAAVQVAESRFADDNLHLRQQGDRQAHLRVYSSDQTGPAGYGKLKKLSEDWRYEATVPRADQVQAAWNWAANVAAALKEPWPPA
jgi:hypothetical protein